MKNSKVRGSAMYLGDGGFIFSPYNENTRESIWKKAVMVDHGKLRSTNTIVQMTLTVDLDEKDLNQTFLDLFATLMLKLPEVL